MQTEIVISGFGGQGVLFAAQVLAYAAMDSGLEVSWFPSYGPEMRGGTANCTTIISDEAIGSPLVRNPQAVIVMNLPSLDKYGPMVREGGVIVINSSLINRSVQRDDLDIVAIPANEMAENLGDKRLANMVMIGALLDRLPVLTLDSIVRALKDHTSERHKHLVSKNEEALKQGMYFANKLQFVK